MHTINILYQSIAMPIHCYAYPPPLSVPIYISMNRCCLSTPSFAYTKHYRNPISLVTCMHRKPLALPVCVCV